MFIWWSIGLIGYIFVGTSYCDDAVVKLVSVEQRQDGEPGVHTGVAGSLEAIATNDTNTIAENQAVVTTTGNTPEPFSCYHCINCNSTSDLTPRVCDAGVDMCYTMHKRINNTSRITRRGCSALKGQCLSPQDDQTNSLESITCCTSHRCNQATELLPMFFLSILSLFITIINIHQT